MIKIAILGTGAMTREVIKSLHKESDIQIALVITSSKEYAPIDYANCPSLCSDLGIKCLISDNINSVEAVKALSSHKLDLILSFWHKIIKKSAIEATSRLGIIGTHPTNLPLFKGRHPLHWLIALGIKTSALSFFQMNHEIDNGKIIAQFVYMVEGLSITGLSNNVNELAAVHAASVIRNYFNNSDGSYNQFSREDHRYMLRARTFHDTLLDPRLTCEVAERLIKSYSGIFEGACLQLEKCRVHIESSCRVTNLYSTFHLHSYGHIYKATDAYIDMGFYDGVLRLMLKSALDNELLEIVGKSIHPPTRYLE